MTRDKCIIEKLRASWGFSPNCGRNIALVEGFMKEKKLVDLAKEHDLSATRARQIIARADRIVGGGMRCSNRIAARMRLSRGGTFLMLDGPLSGPCRNPFPGFSRASHEDGCFLDKLWVQKSDLWRQRPLRR
jgi:hypothetical protein